MVAADRLDDDPKCEHPDGLRMVARRQGPCGPVGFAFGVFECLY
jgi:hypothetical protein